MILELEKRQSSVESLTNDSIINSRYILNPRVAAVVAALNPSMERKSLSRYEPHQKFIMLPPKQAREVQPSFVLSPSPLISDFLIKQTILSRPSYIE